MRYLAILLIAHGLCSEVYSTLSSNESLSNPNIKISDDDILLWTRVFMKLSSIKNDTEYLNRNIFELNQRFNELNKRQANLETGLSKLRQSHDVNVAETNIRLRNLENLFSSEQQNVISSQWTTIMRRQDGTIHFNRKWEEYKNGFGNPNGDFFIGLETLHALTNDNRSQELLIVLTDFDGQTRYARYSSFRIGREDEQYAITELGMYSGDAGDAMVYHRGKKFSTLDRDNNSGNLRNCPHTFMGGWWFHDPCYSGHLHGPYRQKAEAKTWGLSWGPWRGWDYSVKYAAMMIRNKM